MTEIKFGTDGWRAIIADTFTVANVERVAYATAQWILKNSTTPVSVIGYDCRFGGNMFAETTARVFCACGIKVYIAPQFISTPMLSLACLTYKAPLGVIITASHNPPAYNGYKLKASFGGPATPATISAVEALIPDTLPVGLDSYENYKAQHKIVEMDFEKDYLDHARAHFDIPAINKMAVQLGYDAMFGAGQNVVRTLLPYATLLHCDNNPGFHGQAPEPIERNLQPFVELLKYSPNLNVGLATDGDADRIGMFDEDGHFVDSHHLILLLIYYLHTFKGLNGKVVIAFSVSDKIKKLCNLYKLPYEVTKVGFKYISEKMVTENVLVGAEESGGIAVAGHIPERDGVWCGLCIMELMMLTGKTMKQLIADIYALVGAFSYDRYDWHCTDAIKQHVLAQCAGNAYTQFGSYKVARVETIDGYKYYFNDNEWMMIRASGTEPLLRIYAEAPDAAGVEAILTATRKTLGAIE